MTDAEREELETLRARDHIHSLGDRPTALAVATIRRIWELEELEKNERDSGLPSNSHG